MRVKKRPPRKISTSCSYQEVHLLLDFRPWIQMSNVYDQVELSLSASLVPIILLFSRAPWRGRDSFPVLQTFLPKANAFRDPVWL
jgi:hypothetical protein